MYGAAHSRKGGCHSSLFTLARHLDCLSPAPFLKQKFGELFFAAGGNVLSLLWRRHTQHNQTKRVKRRLVEYCTVYLNQWLTDNVSKTCKRSVLQGCRVADP